MLYQKHIFVPPKVLLQYLLLGYWQKLYQQYYTFYQHANVQFILQK